MSVHAGSSLLHYRLIEKIGEGGMGVVWKARDTTLDRDVAIKILPPQFAEDEQRLTRFEREARLLAALSHPRIGSIYGLHEDRGVRFLALEYVAGEDLAQVLARGPMPIDEALEVAIGIAEGLEAAHQSGVIHRDLKPANVKRTPDGRVKVLDFGLAKAFEPDATSSSAPSPMESPTVTSAGTVGGMILGTAAYMSPEQARGRVVDKRTDVWALGCILYELLTGETAMAGETVSDTLAQVLKGEIDEARLPAGTPPSVRRLLRRCLRKNAAQRIHDVADVRIVLQETLAGDDDGGVAEAATVEARRGRGGLWALAGLALGALATWAIVGGGGPGTTGRVLEVALDYPKGPGLRVGGNGTQLIGFTPDGDALVFACSDAEGSGSLCRRPLADRLLERIPGTENGANVVFGPAGRDMIFYGKNALWRIPLGGGAPKKLAEPAESTGGAAWTSDGWIYYSQDYVGGLYRIPQDGGEPETVTTVDDEAGEFGHWWPHALPDREYVIYSRWKTTTEDCSLWRVWPAKGIDERLLDQACFGVPLASGWLLFGRGGVVMAMPFDPETGQVSGTATPVIDDAFITPVNGGIPMAVSSRGDLAYLADDEAGIRGTLALVDPRGRKTALTTEPRDMNDVRVSPDGRLLALAQREGVRRDIWIHDIERDATRRFTFDGTNENPAWSSDGRRIVFASMRRGPFELFGKAIDESGAEELLAESAHDVTPGNWSPDGESLVVSTSFDLRRLQLYRPGDALTSIAELPASANTPRFSPDGRWISFQSTLSGQSEIYVMAAPPRTGRWQVSTDGGIDARWSPDGRTIYYGREGALYAVDLEVGSGIRAGKPRLLFREQDLGARIEAYDVMPDGSGFVMILGERDRTPTFRLVLDWTETLERASD